MSWKLASSPTPLLAPLPAICYLEGIDCVSWGGGGGVEGVGAGSNDREKAVFFILFLFHDTTWLSLLRPNQKKKNMVF